MRSRLIYSNTSSDEIATFIVNPDEFILNWLIDVFKKHALDFKFQMTVFIKTEFKDLRSRKITCQSFILNEKEMSSK